MCCALILCERDVMGYKRQIISSLCQRKTMRIAHPWFFFLWRINVLQPCKIIGRYPYIKKKKQNRNASFPLLVGPLFLSLGVLVFPLSACRSPYTKCSSGLSHPGAAQTEVSGDLTAKLSSSVGIHVGHGVGALLCCIRAHLIRHTRLCVVGCVPPFGPAAWVCMCQCFCQCMTNLFWVAAAWR